MRFLSKKMSAFVLAASFFVLPWQADAAPAEIPPRPFAGDMFSDDSFIVDAFDAAGYGAEIRFPYQDDKVYKVYSQVGFVTDLVFEKNEKILYVGGGDTARWKVDTSSVGTPYESYVHIYIKPLAAGITTDFIVNTDRRVYRLMLTSASRYNPVVRWVYEGDKADNGIAGSESFSDGEAGMNPAELDFNFKIDKPELGWAPSAVFRSGNKTYLKMKPDIVNHDLPSFFVIDEEGQPCLVGYRYLNGSFIVDRLFDNAILVAGKKGKIKIAYKGKR